MKSSVQFLLYLYIKLDDEDFKCFWPKLILYIENPNILNPFKTDCKNVSLCPSIRLGLPKLVSCLPMPLHSFTWHIDVPQDGTVNLVSPTGSFQQSLPDQKCNRPVLFNVAERDGYTLGDFCFPGIIQKIQANANISITVRANDISNDISKIKGPFPNVSFSQEIPGKMRNVL